MFESLVAVFHMIIDIVDRKQEKGIKKKTITQNCLMEKWIFLIFIMPKNL